MRLIKKIDEKPEIKVKVWCVEQREGMKERRKLFTVYNTSLNEIEELLMVKFKEK